MEEGTRSADIRNIEAEAAVVASLLVNPELYFYSEDLIPNHFTEESNAYLYFALRELAKKGVQDIDAFNVINMLNLRKGAEYSKQILTVENVRDAIETAKNIARTSKEDYRICVDRVLDAAFRRNTYQKLCECERMCFSGTGDNIEQKIYQTLDSVMAEFSTSKDVPEYKDVVDRYWEEIQARQSPEQCGAIPFKFKTLNSYVMIERGELVIFGAEQKMGKSMLLLNCAVDLLRRDNKVLYLDSELNSRLFTCRMISHLTGIPFQKIRGGGYGEEEKKLIREQLDWLKTRSFTHLYMPIFDAQTIYTTVKRVFHQQGIDVLIIDYFKGGDDPDAFATYQHLGGLVDLVKNQICGEMNIAGIGAAQSTTGGILADSKKIARNASTIIMIQNKDQREIETDGEECGNKKLIVKFNRNGPQMAEGEYLDMVFDGNRISYEEAPKQHMPQSPY